MQIRVLVCVLALTLQAKASDASLLVPGAPQSGTISSGESHPYRLVLAPGQYVQIDLTQKNIDLALAGEGAGMEPQEADAIPAREAGPEILHVIAGSPEPITITVRALPGHGRQVRQGAYELLAGPVRQATDADRLELEAQGAFSRAKALAATGKALSIREAIPLLERSADAAQRAGDKRMRALALIDLAQANQAIRENAAALRVWEGLLPLLAELGWTRNVGLTHQTIGWIYEGYGEYQKALEYHRKALDILSSEPDSANGHPTVLASIGAAYAAAGDSAKALESFERSLKLYRETKSKRGEAIVLLDIAQVHAATGDHTKALALFEQALAMFRETSSVRREAQVLAAIGRIHSARGEYAQAAPMFENALEKAQSTGDRRLEAIVLDELGELHLRQGALEEARGRYQAALTIQRETRDRRNESLSLYGLARVDASAGRLPEARASIDEALAIVESIRGGVEPRELRVSFRAATSDLYEAQIDILMDLHQREPDRGWAVMALEASERARARVLTEALQRVTTEIHGADTSLLERQKSLRDRLVDKESARTEFLLTGGADAVPQTEAELSALVDELAKTDAAIHETDPRYAQLVAPRTVTASSIQRELLDPDTALVEYAIGVKRSFVWAVTRDSIAVRRLPGRGEIERLARRAQTLLTARNRTVENESLDARRARVAKADRDLLPVTRELYEVLLGPVRSAVGVRRLLVVPDGPLHLLPFAAMHDGTSALAAHREVVVIPSASALAALRRTPESARPGATIAVLADPVFRADDARLRNATPSATVSGASRSATPLLPRLRFSRREAELVGSMIRGSDKLIALDFDARRDVLARAGDYRILHFATHALVDSDAPERSSLVLSLVDRDGAPLDGFVRLGEIFNLDLHSDLVVLSACDTAAGKEMRGEGLMSLTHGFLYAGARRVISTLWRVDDRATAELMKHFYRGVVKDSLSPAAALRLAQEELARDKRWSSPYYWAAFVLQGEPR